MFGRKKPFLATAGKMTAGSAVAPGTVRELAGRFANLFMICYQRRDISGIHVTLTALTHTLHALKVWDQKRVIMEDTRKFILLGGLPQNEIKAVDWLLNHYFEQDNDSDESALLGWYQSIDDEWVLRKKLRELFPEKNNSELTALIAAEQKK